MNADTKLDFVNFCMCQYSKGCCKITQKTLLKPKALKILFKRLSVIQKSILFIARCLPHFFLLNQFGYVLDLKWEVWKTPFARLQH